MTETQTEPTPAANNDQQAWQAAAAASAEAQRPEDPPPKYGVEELECQLTDREHAKMGMAYVTAQNEIDAFDEETKTLLAERKAERAKLEETAKNMKTAALTGRMKRKVRVVTYTSLAQNRKWQVRLDTKAEIDEWPLEGNDRQANLPLTTDLEKGEQLGLDKANDGLPESDEEEDELVAEMDQDFIDELATVASGGEPANRVEDSTTNLQGDPDEPPEGTDITNPADVLSGKGAKKKSSKKAPKD